MIFLLTSHGSTVWLGIYILIENLFSQNFDDIENITSNVVRENLILL